MLNEWNTKQDKVNYAVSDREDMVTGATMLTRMAGCNRMYWAATQRPKNHRGIVALPSVKFWRVRKAFARNP